MQNKFILGLQIRTVKCRMSMSLYPEFNSIETEFKLTVFQLLVLTLCLTKKFWHVISSKARRK